MESAFPPLMPSSSQQPTGLAMAPGAKGAAIPRRPLLGRLFKALVASPRREADREIARLIEKSGRRLTDSLEREAERRVVGLR